MKSGCSLRKDVDRAENLHKNLLADELERKAVDGLILVRVHLAGVDLHRGWGEVGLPVQSAGALSALGVFILNLCFLGLCIQERAEVVDNLTQGLEKIRHANETTVHLEG